MAALLAALAFVPAIPERASAAPTLRPASSGRPTALRTERILDRATLAAWGVTRPSRLAFDGDGALYILTSNRDGRGTARPGDDHIYRLTPNAP